MSKSVLAYKVFPDSQRFERWQIKTRSKIQTVSPFMLGGNVKQITNREDAVKMLPGVFVTYWTTSTKGGES